LRAMVEINSLTLDLVPKEHLTPELIALARENKGARGSR